MVLLPSVRSNDSGETCPRYRFFLFKHKYYLNNEQLRLRRMLIQKKERKRRICVCACAQEKCYLYVGWSVAIWCNYLSVRKRMKTSLKPGRSWWWYFCNNTNAWTHHYLVHAGLCLFLTIYLNHCLCRHVEIIEILLYMSVP